MTSTPVHSPNRFIPDPSHLGLIAVGFSGGQGKAGVDAAPHALIEAGLLTQLTKDLEYTVHHDGKVHDYTSHIPASDPPVLIPGSIAPMLNPRAVSAVTRELASQVYEHASKGRLVLTLGGDHSIAIGTVAGVQKATKERTGQAPVVVWVDAHADVNTPLVSESGNIHGMPLAFLLDLFSYTPDSSSPNAPAKEELFGWLEPEQKLAPANLIYIGLRDVDKAEKKILRQHAIRAYSMHDVDKHGIGKLMDMVMSEIGDRPVHLSFDVDALDPMWAPSTGTPVRGGLTLREGDYICECLHEGRGLVAVDLVEVNPHITEEGATTLQGLGAQETIRAGCSLVRCALGESLL